MDVSLTKGHHRHEGDSGVKSSPDITADRPADLYDHPTNLFVAGFIG